MSAMISLPVDAGLFTFRAAAVWIHDGHILLQGDPTGDFWVLPGGRVEFMEPAEVALRRELREELELGEQTRIERLLWVMETFFQSPEWGDGPVHALSFTYLITPSEADVARLGDTSHAYPCAEPGSELLFRWFALADLPATRPILPPFFNSSLLDLPAAPQMVLDQRM
jgi:ADP-ribose pyrophosphatase YjhB (NUDIX family)